MILGALGWIALIAVGTVVFLATLLLSAVIAGLIGYGLMFAGVYLSVRIKYWWKDYKARR